MRLIDRFHILITIAFSMMISLQSHRGWLFQAIQIILAFLVSFSRHLLHEARSPSFKLFILLHYSEFVRLLNASHRFDEAKVQYSLLLFFLPPILLPLVVPKVKHKVAPITLSNGDISAPTYGTIDRRER